MRAELTAPLVAELRFAGRRFDGARLAGAGRRIAARRTEEFQVLAVSLGVALGSDTAADRNQQIQNIKILRVDCSNILE
ncbi:hypothetical protein BAE44_0024853 [Dichanthelium oligosanthes]|uniref:Uncharacterized protein n=1 Tax=Dichanthelium oligosanthes TaxID=888268 RepID=A0A1E5UMM7_9POAL|nr:hypothetical protein BAE44_0024853 [Dichanthelium oligosanthes]